MKNTRIMCTTVEATKTRAAQWWICRMSRPPRTSNDMFTVEAKASETSLPCIGSYGPEYSTRPTLGM